MTLNAAAASTPALAATLSSLLPLVVVVGGVYLLQRRGLQLWHALACLVLGILLAGTSFGAQISSFLSQLSGGHL